MKKDSYFGMGGYGYYGKITIFLADLMCFCIDICYNVAESRKEVFVKRSRANEKDGLEKIPEIRVFEAFAESRGGLKHLI